jgi:hypothetical protein
MFVFPLAPAFCKASYIFATLVVNCMAPHAYIWVYL